MKELSDNLSTLKQQKSKKFLNILDEINGWYKIKPVVFDDTKNMFKKNFH